MEKSEKQSEVVQGNTNNLNHKVFGRFFQLTLNNEKNGDPMACNYILNIKYNKIIEYLKGRKQLKYFISCRELNKKGFYHIHIYCQFDKFTKLSLKKTHGAHIEICRGSTDDNINYIKKDGNIIEEYGTPILNYNNLTIKEVIEHKNNDDLLNCNVKYINCINNIKNNSIQWLQNGEMDKKNIIITNKIDDYKKYCKFINVENNQYLGLDKNIIIRYDIVTNKLVKDLLTMDNIPLNCKHQIYYPNDIKLIIFYYNNINDFYKYDNWDKFRGYLNYHNVFVRFDNIKLNTIRNITIDRSYWGEDHYADYTGDYSEEN